MAAEFFSGRLVRCTTHDYKTHQRGVPTHKDCLVCALCRVAHELETSIYTEDIELLIRFSKTFGKKTMTYTKSEVGDDKGHSGKPVKRRRRSRVSNEEKEHSVPEDSDGVRTGTACVPE